MEAKEDVEEPFIVKHGSILDKKIQEEVREWVENLMYYGNQDAKIFRTVETYQPVNNLVSQRLEKAKENQ